jgi:hypothetical protein
LARESGSRTSRDRERDRVEADLLLAVIVAHMAFRTASSPNDAYTARMCFTEAVRELYYGVVEAGSEKSSGLSQGLNGKERKWH